MKRGEGTAKQEVRLQYRLHTTSGNLAGISGNILFVRVVSGKNKMAGPLYLYLAGGELPWEDWGLFRQGGFRQKRQSLKELTDESFLITFLSTARLQILLEGGPGLQKSMSTSLLLRNLFYPS